MGRMKEISMECGNVECKYSFYGLNRLRCSRKGYLTESGENRVFIPDGQSTIIEFNININLRRE